MKITFKVLLLFIGIFGVIVGVVVAECVQALAKRAPKFPTRAFLAALSQVESANNPFKPGPSGELGIYQFKSARWIRFSRRPFSEARTNPKENEAAARRCLASILKKLAARRLPLTAEFAAAAWHWDENFDASLAGTDYAQRVANLTGALEAGK